jgi:hypothetical protein
MWIYGQYGPAWKYTLAVLTKQGLKARADLHQLIHYVLARSQQIPDLLLFLFPWRHHVTVKTAIGKDPLQTESDIDRFIANADFLCSNLPINGILKEAFHSLCS